MIRLLILAGLVCASSSFAAPPPCDPGPKAIQEWKGYDSRHPQFRKITHIAVAPSGSVYLLDQELELIHEFSSGGTFLKTLELPGGCDFLKAMAASDSFLYVSDGDNTFQMFRDGSIATWQRGAVNNGLATDRDGNVYISQSLSGIRYLEAMKKDLNRKYYETRHDSLTRELGIWKVTSQGDALEHWPAPPWPIALDPTGNLYAVEPDSGKALLSVFNGESKVRACRMGLVRTIAFRCIAIGPEGHFFINDRDAVVETDQQGNVIRRWCDPGPNYDLIRSPSSLSVDGRGYLYVADYSNSRVIKFDLTAP